MFSVPQQQTLEQWIAAFCRAIANAHVIACRTGETVYVRRSIPDQMFYLSPQNPWRSGDRFWYAVDRSGAIQFDVCDDGVKQTRVTDDYQPVRTEGGAA